MPKIRPLEFLPAPDRPEPPGAELHVWRADLDAAGWPQAEELPEEERQRAAGILTPLACRRWVASRWALRGVLGRYLHRPPAELRFELGEHGKPRLDPADGLFFNLSHSEAVTLIAVAAEGEVGVDVERIAAKHPAAFYARWADQEARLKCLGTGFGPTPPAEAPEPTVHRLDPDPGYAASVAVAAPPTALRCWTFDPPLR